MTMRTVTIPDGRSVPLADYLDAWKRLARHEIAPTAVVGGFFTFSASASEILDEMRRGLHDRINRRDPNYGRGRCWDSEYQHALKRDALRLNTPRRIVRTLETDHARRRFADRITRTEDL